MTTSQMWILVAVSVVVLTSVWAALDARKHGISTHGHTYQWSNGALVWLLACLVLWIPFFPGYLVRRHEVLSGRRRRAEAEAAFDRRLTESPPVEWDDPAIAGIDPWDLVAIGHAQRLRGLDPVHVAPDIPPRLLTLAQKTFLRLEPGELLLAIVDPLRGGRPDRMLALTTRGIHGFDPGWRGAPARGSAPGGLLGVPGPGPVSYRLTVPYTALGGRFAADAAEDPDPTEPDEGPLPRIGMARLDRGLQAPLRAFLDAVGPAARRRRPALTAAMVEHARSILPALREQAERVRSEQQGVVDFHAGLRAATRKVVVTPVLAAACVAVFAAMMLRGVSPVEPSIEALLDWGASFGPYFAVDHEYWRLFTSMFLHIGFLHIAFNMWCLLSAGPMVERFFGNLAFAAIYVLSGLGGQLASVSFHPLTISAGASGAIFGVFGALVGFLVIQHQTIPATLLRPMRASALTFIGYNIVFGMANERIDNAAHLGGLATGFVCGLLLSRRLPVVPDRRGVARRVLAVAGLSLALVLGTQAAADRLAADPQVRTASREKEQLARSFNDLMERLRQPIEHYDRASRQLNALLERLRADDRLTPDDLPRLDRLRTELTSDLDALGRAPVREPELRKILDAYLDSQRGLRDALRYLRRDLSGGAAGGTPDPGSYDEAIEASNRATEQFVALRERFLKDHGFETGPASPDAGRRRP